jgi:hypothetical protein
VCLCFVCVCVCVCLSKSAYIYIYINSVIDCEYMMGVQVLVVLSHMCACSGSFFSVAVVNCFGSCHHSMSVATEIIRVPSWLVA